MKIGVVGAGMVGATTAYALVMRGIGREIVLVDKNASRLRAEADDLLHAVPFANPMRVSAGDYPALKGAKVVVLTAGVAQKPGETRIELLQRNAAICQGIVRNILTHAPEALLVVATNPVDVLTHLTARVVVECGGSASRVIGSGTTLDTARFRALLSLELGVDARHIHAYVLGEHGDTEVLAWSLATVGGVPLDLFCRSRGIELDAEKRSAIDSGVRRAAYSIIEGKGSTYFGIGSALASLVKTLLRDDQTIRTVSTPAADVLGVRDVTISLPRIVNASGIVDTLPIPLSPLETERLRSSALAIRRAIESLES
ncbi:MAG: L-lactate dehydrogenase [Acidobacteria bacterium]|nr:L-lactate dehydrogenase [Acidobacteriota bacterium]MCG3191614.1 L-lactate dehydrogenase [Thermoanaerobaculia bacterium]